MKLCNDQLKVHLHPFDLDFVTRLKKRDNKQHPDVMLTLTTQKKKEEILKAKKKIKDLDKQIYINEQLTIKQGEIFANARSLVKKNQLKASWTWRGRVFVKQHDDAAPILVKIKADLDKLLTK
jgi:hypothetical protein